MLGILLSVLKILGILLLALLVLIILVLAVILLVPVRYRFSGKFHEDEKNIHGRITWFFRLVHISVSADHQGMKLVPRILGREWNHEKKKKRKTAGKKEKEQNTGTEKIKKENRETEDIKNKTQKILEKTESDHAEEFAGSNAKDSSEKSIFRKIYDKIKGVVDFILAKADVCRKALADISELNEKKNKVFDFFCEEEALDAKNRTFEIVKKAARHIRPCKLQAWVRFGLEYPDQTGQLYAVLCMLYGIYGKNVVLEPDFDHIVFEGEFRLKGRIRLLNLIYYAIYLYRIKKLKEFIELLKNL